MDYYLAILLFKPEMWRSNYHEQCPDGWEICLTFDDSGYTECKLTVGCLSSINLELKHLNRQFTCSKEESLEKHGNSNENFYG